jgi:hypothetical protein
LCAAHPSKNSAKAFSPFATCGNDSLGKEATGYEALFFFKSFDTNKQPSIYMKATAESRRNQSKYVNQEMCVNQGLPFLEFPKSEKSENDHHDQNNPGGCA